MNGNCGIVLKILILGYLCDLYTCAQGTCSPNPCLNGGRCSSYREGQFECSCGYGWKGHKCEENIDDCRPGVCQNGGQCIDEDIARYHCNCTVEYAGFHCEYKNPCFVNPCKNGATCVNVNDNKINCNCPKYYMGDLCDEPTESCPLDYEDVKKMCGLHGKCDRRGDGRIFCNCDHGYSGLYCEEKTRPRIDIGCKEDFCLNGGTCLIRESGLSFCRCPQYFQGDRCQHFDKNAQPFKSNREINSTKIATSACSSDCVHLAGNGLCDQRCNNEKCNFDDGDCDPWKKCKGPNVVHCRKVFRDNKCNPECNSVDCLFDGQDCDRSTCLTREHCSHVYQNAICNQECNNPQCGFDGGDCQGKQSDSFFSHTSAVQKCHDDRKVFELDLILLTTMDNFLMNRSKFLQSLGSALKMVLTISQITEIKFNSTPALSIKLAINPTECIIYGGQCFSSLDQISNFINAGIHGNGSLSLPFRVAKVDSKTIYSDISNRKKQINSYFTVLIAVSLALMISIAAIGVLLRDKWGKLRAKVKTAGVWTPSDGYSTSTLSINSNNKSGWPGSLQPQTVKLENHLPTQLTYDNDLFKYNYRKYPQPVKITDTPIDNLNRKRKFEVIDTSPKALSFQVISEHLQKLDGVNPLGSTQTKLLSLINENVPIKTEERYTVLADSSTDIGAYVNDSGESLMHIASRMNCGPNIIKKLHTMNPGMLQTTDEWGRTPLSTAVASDAFESFEQLLSLEKQSRKELKQNKSRAGQIPSIGTVDSPVKKTTALIEAVKSNSKDIISLLLDEGSPVNSLDSSGRSVVHWAAVFNNVPLLERLSHMKLFQKLVDLKDNEDRTPLFLAANEGSLDSATFIVEFITKIGIKIDSNFPCPQAIAAEKGFTEIESLIAQAQLPAPYSEKACKRMKLKDQKLIKKLSSLHTPTRKLEVIEDDDEYFEENAMLAKNSPSGNDSIDSCLFDVYSVEDSSFNNILDSCSNERNNYSSFKPDQNNCHSYISNTSSSDMSPPLLNLKYPSTLSGYNCHSEPQDTTLQSDLFFDPSQVMMMTSNDHIITNNNNKALERSSKVLYQREPPFGADPYQLYPCHL